MIIACASLVGKQGQYHCLSLKLHLGRWSYRPINISAAISSQTVVSHAHYDSIDYVSSTGMVIKARSSYILGMKEFFIQ